MTVKNWNLELFNMKTAGYRYTNIHIPITENKF